MNNSRHLLLPLVIFLAGLSPATAQTDPGQREARQAEAELRSFREDMEREYLPLSAELRALRETLRERERELARIVYEQDQRTVEIDRLRDRIASLSRSRTFVLSALDELFNAWEASLHAPQRPAHASALEEWFSLDSSERSLAQAGEILVAMVNELKSGTGGLRSEGEAVAPDGRILPGTFLFFGPLGYFVAADEQLAGLIDPVDPFTARVIPQSGEPAEAIRRLLAGTAAAVPVDVTGGQAFRLRDARPSLRQEIGMGGVWIYPILFGAFITFAMALTKSWQIAGVRPVPAGLLHPLVEQLQRGNWTAAAERAGAIRSPVRAIFTRAVDSARLPVELLEDEIYGEIIRLKRRLERGTAVFNVTAATAPLLGLLGTVTGMIATFQRIAVFGTGDPRSLSEGISEALITTKYGLIVAIPAFILGAYFRRRIAGVATTLEKQADLVVKAVASPLPAVADQETVKDNAPSA